MPQLPHIIDLCTRYHPHTLHEAREVIAVIREAAALPRALSANGDLATRDSNRAADLQRARSLVKSGKASTATSSPVRKPAAAAVKPSTATPPADRNAAARAALWKQYQSLPAGEARREFFHSHRAQLYVAAREVQA